jgi:GTPase SAR1 family protein
MLIGAGGVGKSSLLHQFLSTSEDHNNLGAIINSTRNLTVDNEQYLLELIECEEFGYVMFHPLPSSKCQ